MLSPPAASRPEPAQPTIFAARWDLAEIWPEELRNEISQAALANVSVPLTPLPVYDQSVNGSLVVYAEPEGALIRMRSRNVSAGWLYSGSSPMNMSSILPGDYVVFASKEHYPTKTVFAHVTAGQATVLNITLVKLN